VPASATRPYWLVYGSQTGNAQEVARSIADDAAEHGVPLRLLAMNDAADVCAKSNCFLSPHLIHLTDPLTSFSLN
jgi:sulfite reductase alpha subunit-like flavoprotein